MQQNTFIILFIISMIIVCLNGNRYHGNVDDDTYSLYKLFQKRKSSSFTTTQKKFQEQMLEAHNKYRSSHCAPPLTLDDDLSHSAQKYAEHLASTNRFEHSDNEDIGENLFKMTSSREIQDFDGAIPTKSWYDEIKLYDFDDPKFSEETGHFTQLIWKDTEKVGVGFATGKQKSKHTLYAVAQYTPPGNFNDEFSENVLPDKC